MERAIRIRKVLGGAMRQVGFMAAAGIYALDNHVERLAEDHKKAFEIAEVLKSQSYIKSVEPTETNIVIFYLRDGLEIDKFLVDMEEKNVKVSNMGQGKLRLVTHLDYTQKLHEQFLEILNNF